MLELWVRVKNRDLDLTNGGFHCGFPLTKSGSTIWTSTLVVPRASQKPSTRAHISHPCKPSTCKPATCGCSFCIAYSALLPTRARCDNASDAHAPARGMQGACSEFRLARKGPPLAQNQKEETARSGCRVLKRHRSYLGIPCLEARCNEPVLLPSQKAHKKRAKDPW